MQKGAVIGLKSRSTESTERGLNSICQAKAFDPIRYDTQRQDNETHKKQMWVKIVCTVGQGTPRDSVLAMVRLLGDVDRPTISRQCKHQ